MDLSFNPGKNQIFAGIKRSFQKIISEVTPKLMQAGPNEGKPSNSKNVRRESNTFNKYVKLHEGAIWDSRASGIHGLSPNDESDNENMHYVP